MTCKDCIHTGLCYKENDYDNFPYRCGSFISDKVLDERPQEDATNKLQKIQKIVDDWNNSDIIGDEQDVDRYFCKILELFKEATNENDN